MPLLHIVVLAIVQGITEFLPVSSWAHLQLVSLFAGWPDHGLIIEVALHVGTLGAVMLYLWRDILAILVGLGRAAKGRQDAGAALAGYLVIATIPVVIAGFTVHYFLPAGIRGLTVIGWATLGFGIVLYLADRLGMTLRRIEHLGVADAVIIGLAQVLALIPGTSRAGITMSAARLLGLERTDAARFSMLLSIPTIIGAATLEGFKLASSGDVDLSIDALLAAGLAFVSAIVAILAMMAWLKKATFLPFVIYRVVLGLVLLALAYGLAPWP